MLPLLVISLPITPQPSSVRVLHYALASLAWTGSTINRLMLSFCVSASLLTGGTGISTSCPSPTTFVLGLGPDLPWADEPSPGNLGLSTCKFLACISLLIPAFSLLHRPRSSSDTASASARCSSTEHLRVPEASVVCFSPGHLRRTITRPVSYYALFECVAASKPTSWLSVQFTHPFPLNTHLGTLAVDLGCFPFDYGSYNSQSDSQYIINTAFEV